MTPERMAELMMLPEEELELQLRDYIKIAIMRGASRVQLDILIQQAAQEVTAELEKFTQ